MTVGTPDLGASTLGVGIVGCGLIGRKRAAQLPDGMRLVRCFDVDPERAGSVAAASGVPDGAAASVEELLAGPRRRPRRGRRRARQPGAARARRPSRPASTC